MCGYIVSPPSPGIQPRMVQPGVKDTFSGYAQSVLYM